MVFDKVYRDLMNKIDTYSCRFRNCILWYEHADTSEEVARKYFLQDARHWLNMRNECVRKLNKMRGNKEQIFDEWTFPY